MRQFIFLSFFIFLSIKLSAQKIYGTVTSENGALLPFASITIKGTSSGVSANKNAHYTFNLPEGTYQLVCQYIGYEIVEKTVVLKEDQKLDFTLKDQKLLMKEVVVKKGGEDPAYEIIRQAIKKRSYYNNQVKHFSVELYTKDLIKLRSLPKKIFGQKIPERDKKEMGVDSTGKGIIYLSEATSKVSAEFPNKFKMDVLGSRVSGGDGFGFTFPVFISLYKNNVNVFTEKLNPRGFVSPIADGAISFYKYKYLGTFIENGKAINTIKVTPRRTYEPLFEGVINITEDEWRIHSFDLVITKSAQLEIMDTLRISQLYVPVTSNVWQVKNQLLSFNFKKLQIDAVGSFLTVYSNYDIDPVFDKKKFDRVLIKYDTAVNKKTIAFWDSIRPIQLEPEEKDDYKIKDSLFLLQSDSLYSKSSIDSMKKQQGKIKLSQLFFGGVQRTHFSKTNEYQWGIDPLLMGTQYNTAEGVNLELGVYYSKMLKKINKQLYIKPYARYGFSNKHFNGWVYLFLQSNDWGNQSKNKRVTWLFSGGKRVSQYNKEIPVLPLVNTVSTLLHGKNYMKTYENYYGMIGVNKKFDNGVSLSGDLVYEDRMPIFNTTDFIFFNKNSYRLTENYPVERVSLDEIYRHQALIANVEISVQPGKRYIQFPQSKISIGSKYPTFVLHYSKGIKNILGSDVNFDKWMFSVKDNKNFKLAGSFSYKFSVGGFLNRKQVFIQDYKHFNANLLKGASEYVNSFQLTSSYGHSNTADFYALGHVEHHFNGLFTNKIPKFKKLNWFLVAGSNAFYVNDQNNFIEFFAGLENIFRVFRVDFVNAYENGHYSSSAIVIGAGGILGGSNTKKTASNVVGRSVSVRF